MEEGVTTRLDDAQQAKATSVFRSPQHRYEREPFDTNGHVNQLYYTGAAWINQDLTAAAQAGTTALPGSAIGSFLYNNADHVFYLDPSRRINHLWWTGQQWQNEAVSANARFSGSAPRI